MEKHIFWFSKRFLVCILAFLGEMNIFASKANLNIAILDMTGNREIVVNNVTVIQTAEFNWDSETKGFVIGVSNYGILLSPLGGYLALKYGGSTILAISTLIVSILTILTPLVVRSSFLLFIFIRIVEGMSETFRYVSFFELWTQWSPLKDRSKLIAITLCGMYAGPAITYPIFGYVIRKYGWQAPFYFSGGFSFLWTLIWYPLVPNSPALDKYISKKELDYIQQDPPQSRPKNLKSVWWNIIFSKHVFALGMTKVIFNLGLTVTITCLPMYIEDLTGSTIDKIGIYSAIPNFINIFTPPCIGYLVDFFKNSTKLTTTQIYKLFMSTAFGFGSILLFAMTQLPNNLILLITCLTLYKATLCVTMVMSDLNAVALAPKCSSFIASYTSLFHTLGSVIGPLIIAYAVTGHVSIEYLHNAKSNPNHLIFLYCMSLSQWNISFVIFAVISFVGAVLFFALGSGEPQPWSYSVEKHDESNNGPFQSQEIKIPIA